jgi:hypothetical protein
VLLISHRLSTLGNVDEIIVLKDGRVVEQGSYKDLKRQGGVFAGLLEEQNRYNLERAGNKSIIRSAFVNIAPVYEQRQAPVVPVTPQSRPAAPGWQSPAPVPVRGQSYDGRRPEPQGQPGVSPSAAYVFVELDGKIVGKCQLNRPVLTVGRHSNNDIQVANKRVSRLHAKIRQENETWLIEDVGSVNGLIYQGRRVEQLTLTNGDRIYIAPTAVLHYKLLP